MGGGTADAANVAEQKTFTEDTTITKDNATEKLGKINTGTYDKEAKKWTADPDYSYNIKVTNGSSLNITGVPLYAPKIESNGDVTLDLTGTLGLFLGQPEEGLYQKADITAKNLTINAANTNNWRSAFCLYGGNDNINRSGNHFTLNVQDNVTLIAGTDSNVIVVDSNTIYTDGENRGGNSITINAGSLDMYAPSHASIINNGKNTPITINVRDYIKAEASSGISNNDAGTGVMSITAGGDINVLARNYYGLSAGGDDLYVTSNNGNININASHSSSSTAAIQANNSNPLAVTAKNGTIDVYGDLRGIWSRNKANITLDALNNIIICPTDGRAIHALTGGTVSVNSTNNTQVTGDITAESGGQATVGFDTADSFLYGYVKTAYEDSGSYKGENSLTDLDFTNGSKWLMTADSNVTDLTFKDSLIDMTANDEGNARLLTVDKAMTGNGGVFKMDLKYIDNSAGSYESGTASDFVKVNGTNDGTYTVSFADGADNLGAMKVKDKLYFASVNSAGSLNFGEGETIERVNRDGLYDAEFTVGYDNNRTSDYNDWFITYDKNKLNPNADTPVSSYKAGFALWRDDDTLLKRLGELRYANDEGGAWARVIGRKYEMDGSHGFTTHAKTIQAGYDRKDVQSDGSGTWRKGIALGYTEADTSFAGGSGDNDYWDLTLYGTNIRSKDHYLDLVARIGQISSEYDTSYGDHADFKNLVGSLSAEYGRKKKISSDNWFIEPQAQLTYSYMWGDDFTTSKGFKVSQDNMDSLVGRLGFVISREFETERKTPNRFYAKASVLHEFLGDGGVLLSDGSRHFYEDADFDDTWYVVGLGFNADMGNYCSAYFDAEKAFSASVEMPYRIEAGFRWEF